MLLNLYLERASSIKHPLTFDPLSSTELTCAHPILWYAGALTYWLIERRHLAEPRELARQLPIRWLEELVFLVDNTRP